MFAVGIDTRGKAPEVDMAAHNEIALQTARQGICAKRMAQAPGEFSPSVRASFLSGCLPQVTRWPTAGPQAPGTVPGTAPGHASGPVRRPGLTWGYAWQVLGSNQRRRMPAILQGAHSCPSEWPLTCYFPFLAA
jgi:hypothetical protein